MKGKPLTPICPHCNGYSKAVKGDVIYPHRPDLAHLNFFRCEPCDAYVGTHRGSGAPLGTLANSAVRKARNGVHAVFDPIWYDSPSSPDQYKEQRKKRTGLYAWLAQSMGLHVDECHIAMFNEDQCKLAIKLCRERASQG